MRIAICTDQYLPLLSGVADSIATLKDELKKRGHEVRIYAPATPGYVRDPDILRIRQIAIPGSAQALMIAIPLGILKDLRAFKPDIIHTHSTGIIGLRGALAARKLKVPLVGTSHTLPAYYLHYFKLDNALGRYLIRSYTAAYFDFCTIVSAPSSMMIDELKAYGMRKPARTISNQIRTDLFVPFADKHDWKRAHAILPKAVLLFGRIAKEKNVEEALDVFEEVVRLSAETQLVVVGDGPYRPQFQASVRKRALSENVKDLGARHGEDLVQIINACDVFLITSESETQSMTTLQAMACGLPVVAVRAGALPEYVRNGDNGFVCEPQDIKTLAQRIRDLLSDPALAHRLGEEGHKTALRYSPSTIVAAFERMYTDALRTDKEII